MKKLLLVMLLQVSFLFSQTNDTIGTIMNCEDLVVKEYDKVTGNTNIGGKSIFINNNEDKKGFIINLLKDGKIINLVVNVGNACIESNDKINILFRDGSRIELGNMAKYNCQGVHIYSFGATRWSKKLLDELTAKEVEIMRVHTARDFIEQTFTQEQSIQFKKTLKCLSEI